MDATQYHTKTIIHLSTLNMFAVTASLPKHVSQDRSLMHPACKLRGLSTRERQESVPSHIRRDRSCASTHKSSKQSNICTHLKRTVSALVLTSTVIVANVLGFSLGIGLWKTVVRVCIWSSRNLAKVFDPYSLRFRSPGLLLLLRTKKLCTL